MDPDVREQIPIHTHWSQSRPGSVEIDTVALWGGRLDDRHGWMVDAVDGPTTWSGLESGAREVEIFREKHH